MATGKAATELPAAAAKHGKSESSKQLTDQRGGTKKRERERLLRALRPSRRFSRLGRPQPGLDSASTRPRNPSRQFSRLGLPQPGLDPASTRPRRVSRQFSSLGRPRPGLDSASTRPRRTSRQFSRLGRLNVASEGVTAIFEIRPSSTRPRRASRRFSCLGRPRPGLDPASTRPRPGLGGRHGIF